MVQDLITLLSEKKTNGLRSKKFASEQNPNRERLKYLVSEKKRAQHLKILLYEKKWNKI